MCIGGECISSTTDIAQNQVDNGSSFPDSVQHNCGHCCHYGHAINTFWGHQAMLRVNQLNFAEHYNSSPSHIPYGIKRPPRITT